MYFKLFLTIGFLAITFALADPQQAFKVIENEDIKKCKHSIFKFDLNQENSLNTPWISQTSAQFYQIKAISKMANMRGSDNDDVVGVGFKTLSGSVSTDHWCLPPGIYTLSLSVDTANLKTSIKACMNEIVKPGESKTIVIDENGVCSSKHTNYEKPSLFYSVPGYTFDTERSDKSWSNMPMSKFSYDLTFNHCFPDYSIRNSAKSASPPATKPTVAPTRRPTPSPTKAGDVAVQVSVGVSLAGVTSVNDAKKLGPSLIKAMETSLKLSSGSVSITGYEEVVSSRRQLTGFQFSLFQRSLTVTAVKVDFKVAFLASQVMSSSSGYSVSDAVEAMNAKIQSVVVGTSSSSVFLQNLKTEVNNDNSLSTLVNQIQGVAATEVVNTSPTTAPTSAPGSKSGGAVDIAIIAGAAGGGGGAVLIGLAVYYFRGRVSKVTVPETQMRSVAPL